MASVLIQSLAKASWDRQVSRCALICQACGSAPRLYERQLPDYMGKKFGLGCPNRHSLIESELVDMGPGADLSKQYEAMFRNIGPMIEAWNDKQNQLRNSQIFPKPANAQA